jgi:signal peptidase I
MLVVVALVLTFLIQTFIAKVYVIPSGSMETTLHGCTGCQNDPVLVDKMTLPLLRPGAGRRRRLPRSRTAGPASSPPSAQQRVVGGAAGLGSLIGLAPPDEKDFVKRVIAVGGRPCSAATAATGCSSTASRSTSPTSTSCPRPGRPGRTRSAPDHGAAGSCG